MSGSDNRNEFPKIAEAKIVRGKYRTKQTENEIYIAARSSRRKKYGSVYNLYKGDVLKHEGISPLYLKFMD